MVQYPLPECSLLLGHCLCTSPCHAGNHAEQLPSHLNQSSPCRQVEPLGMHFDCRHLRSYLGHLPMPRRASFEHTSHPRAEVAAAAAAVELVADAAAEVRMAEERVVVEQEQEEAGEAAEQVRFHRLRAASTIAETTRLRSLSFGQPSLVLDALQGRHVCLAR